MCYALIVCSVVFYALIHFQVIKISLQKPSLCTHNCNMQYKILYPFSLMITNQYFSIVDKDSCMSIFDKSHLSTGRIMDSYALPWRKTNKYTKNNNNKKSISFILRHWSENSSRNTEAAFLIPSLTQTFLLRQCKNLKINGWH